MLAGQGSERKGTMKLNLGDRKEDKTREFGGSFRALLIEIGRRNRPQKAGL